MPPPLLFLVWVWKTWIITAGLKLILVKSGLDLAGNIRYTPQTGSREYLSSSVLADGMLCITRIDAASYLWCQSNARLCNWAFDPDTRMKPELCRQEADAGLIGWGSLNARLCWDQSVDTQSLTIKGCVRLSVCLSVSHVMSLHHFWFKYSQLGQWHSIKYLNTPGQCTDINI